MRKPGGNPADATNRIDTAILPQPDAERKAFESVRARAAFGKCALHELGSGGYLLARWNISRELPDLRAVAALLDLMGIRR